jgi:competence protein ComEA
MHSDMIDMNRPRIAWKQWLYPLRERLVCSEREALILIALSTLLLGAQVVRLVRATIPPAEAAEMARIDSLFDHIADSLRATRPFDSDTVHVGFGTVFDPPTAPDPDTRMWVFTDTLEKPRVTFPLSINEADLRTLQALPRIGPAMAGRIIAWRETHGPFTSGEDLLKVRGIGPRTLEQLLPLVSFEPAQARVDSSSAASLPPDN